MTKDRNGRLTLQLPTSRPKFTLFNVSDGVGRRIPLLRIDQVKRDVLSKQELWNIKQPLLRVGTRAIWENVDSFCVPLMLTLSRFNGLCAVINYLGYTYNNPKADLLIREYIMGLMQADAEVPNRSLILNENDSKFVLCRNYRTSYCRVMTFTMSKEGWIVEAPVPTALMDWRQLVTIEKAPTHLNPELLGLWLLNWTLHYNWEKEWHIQAVCFSAGEFLNQLLRRDLPII